MRRSLWRELREIYGAELRNEAAAAWREAVAGTREMAAAIREERLVTRQGRRLITGLARPTRREVRTAARAIGAENDELMAIERRVVAEHRRSRRRDS
jgi:hypothetical protein